MLMSKPQSKDKPRVYLSKSKMGSMDTLLKVRDMLSKYDIELVEFSGGEYTASALLSCDIFLLLPPVLPMPYNFNFNVGKGQYTEIQTACRIPMYYIVCVGDELYVSNGIEKIHKSESDWKTNYAHIWCNKLMKPIHEWNPYIKLKPILTKQEDRVQYKQNRITKPLLACYSIIGKM